MTSVFGLIQNAIRLALMLGAVGGLVDATIAMCGKAQDAHQQGLVSLGLINRQLLGIRR